MRHDQAIGTDYEGVIKLRSALHAGIQQEEPLYTCAMCGVPVYLVSQKEERRFFFRHTLEDGRCSARTRGELSQDEIDARRYNGVKESQAHIDMKNCVASSLRADPNFNDVEVEQRWAGKFTGEWRKPDVRAKFRGVPVVFEVQLSTTYLNVITARRSFYQREGALLLWVFAKFDVGPRRLTQDDVFFTNNRNAFVVSAATRDLSLTSRAFHLECIWAMPTAGTSAELQRQVVPFDGLTLDVAQQRAFYFDFEAQRDLLLESARQAELARLALLREGFEAWYLKYVAGDRDEQAYAALRARFSAERVTGSTTTGNGRESGQRHRRRVRTTGSSAISFLLTHHRERNLQLNRSDVTRKKRLGCATAGSGWLAHVLQVEGGDCAQPQIPPRERTNSGRDGMFRGISKPRGTALKLQSNSTDTRLTATYARMLNCGK